MSDNEASCHRKEGVSKVLWLMKNLLEYEVNGKRTTWRKSTFYSLFISVMIYLASVLEYTCVYIYIYISSSSCQGASTDFFNSLATHPYRPSLLARSPGYILYWYRGASWSSNFCSSMWRGLQEYITYEFVLTSPAVSCMSGSSGLDSFVMGGRWVHSRCFASRTCSIQLTAFLYNCRQAFSLYSVHVVHPCNSIDMTAVWKKLRFILSVRSDFHMTDNLLITAHAFANLVLMSFSVMRHCFLGRWTCPLVSSSLVWRCRLFD